MSGLPKNYVLMLQYSVNSRLADTPLLWTLAITNKIQITGVSYRGLTENDSCYYRITDTFSNTNITFLAHSCACTKNEYRKAPRCGHFL